MTDIRATLDELAGEPPWPTPTVIRGDLARGRRALRRRRATGLAVATVAATGVFGLVGTTQQGGAFGPAVPSVAVQVASGGGWSSHRLPEPPEPSVPPASAVPVPLVPATGVGSTRTIATTSLPEGWRVVLADEGAVVIARPDDRVTDPSHAFFQVGKVTVQLASATFPDLPTTGERTTVGGRPAVWHTLLGGDAPTPALSWTLSDGRVAEIQGVVTLGWDKETYRRFASTVTIGPDAVAGVG